MQHWEFVEAVLPPYRTIEEKKMLSRKIRNVSVIVLSVALGMKTFHFFFHVYKTLLTGFISLTVEHVFNMVHIVMKAYSDKLDPVKTLFEVQIPLVFTLTELTWWKAVLSKWFNVVVTFAWSFMDLFVMIVSIGLASQFKQLNTDLRKMKGKVIFFAQTLPIKKKTLFYFISYR